VQAVGRSVSPSIRAFLSKITQRSGRVCGREACGSRTVVEGPTRQSIAPHSTGGAVDPILPADMPADPLVALAAVAITSSLAVGCHRSDTSPSPRADVPAAAATAGGPPTAPARSSSLYDLTVRRLDGTPEALSAYRGKVALVVNTASECGYTPQYEGLEALYERRQKDGLVILGFPSNDFGGQEPGSAGEIAAFCKKNYGVSFPMFEKVSTKGAEASPVYQLLGDKLGPPAWNFHKYLVGKDGTIRAVFPSAVAPDDAKLATEIDKLIAE
jgi:glutathione peroxidase